jgi:hypothetical protein
VVEGWGGEVLLYSFRQLLNLDANNEARNNGGEADEDQREDYLQEQRSWMPLLDDPGLE